MSSQINKEGLTWVVWAAAAGIHTTPSPSNEHYSAWIEGEDPAEWKAKAPSEIDWKARTVEAERAYDTCWAVLTELGIAARSVLKEWDGPYYQTRMHPPMMELRAALAPNLDDIRIRVRKRYHAAMFERMRKYAAGLEEDGLIHEPEAIRNMIEEMEKADE